MDAITFFVVIAFLATFVTMMAGGVSMVKGGKFDMLHANEFMQGRLVLHAVTLGLMLIAIFVWSA
jgi:hypothetical protein